MFGAIGEQVFKNSNHDHLDIIGYLLASMFFCQETTLVDSPLSPRCHQPPGSHSVIADVLSFNSLIAKAKAWPVDPREVGGEFGSSSCD